MDSEFVLYEAKDNVATITLNRPQIHNAFNEDVIEKLISAFQRACMDNKIQIVMLKANGKSFSAGADLEWMKKMSSYSFDENVKDSLELAKLLKTIDECPKTTIAVVNGPTYGGGVGLVAACDIAIATEQANFCLSEVKLGLIPAVISPYVVRAIGARQTRRLTLSAERIESHEAMAIGLVTHLCHTDELATKEKYICDLISAGSMNAQKEAKDLIEYVTGKEISHDLIQETAKRIAKARSSDDGKAGVDAFLRSRVHPKS